ncbi:MAG: preprotein translocase subunit SecY, partial [Candidatus Syntropharchaeia archaeon]
MRFRDVLAPLLKRLPMVERPIGHVHFKKKLGWTIGILIIYFVLCNIPLFGLSPDSIDMFERYRAFFAGASFSLVALGIGPIVTASIVLQLLVGAEIIKLDLSDPEDQAFYQGAQKLLVFVMIALEALPLVMGYYRPDPEIARILGVSLDMITLLLFIQLFIGGTLILFMDEVVSKWGIGSGVGLFIVAGVAQAVVTGLINWMPDPDYMWPIGVIPKWIYIATHMSFYEVIGGG